MQENCFAKTKKKVASKEAIVQRVVRSIGVWRRGSVQRFLINVADDTNDSKRLFSRRTGCGAWRELAKERLRLILKRDSARTQQAPPSRHATGTLALTMSLWIEGNLQARRRTFSVDRS
jgi:hypothetical protein